ncbi:hypothetical protein, partial [Lentilactobacillus hilgardii]
LYMKCIGETEMRNNELMMYLELAFINYNEFAMKHCNLSFFTREINSEVTVYTVPESEIFFLPRDLPKILRYITQHEDENLHSLDVIDDLRLLLRKIRKGGLRDYPQKAVNSLNVAVDNILCNSIDLNKQTKYYRVVSTNEKEVELIEIANHDGKPIFSVTRGKSIKVKVTHNAIILKGRLLVRYVHR